MGVALGLDSERIYLENILGALVGVNRVLDIVLVRISNRMRTADEADDARMVFEAMELLQEARDLLAQFHPQALTRHRCDDCPHCASD